MIKLICGDALEELTKLPDRSVHCCVTSPPYYNLRDYGTGQWEGGDPSCSHLPDGDFKYKSDTNHGSLRGGPFRSVCGKCGAIRSDRQIGLEPTPDEYTAKLTEVFAQVHRVLVDDGTLWLNIGDSYVRQPPGNKPNTVQNKSGLSNSTENHEMRRKASVHLDPSQIGMPLKNLIGIPWRVALALQSAGWILRCDIIWKKPNPMPESTTDRPSRCHEYIFLFAKQKQYFYDAVAIQEKSKDAVGSHRSGSLMNAFTNGSRDPYISSRSHGGGVESLLSTGFANKRSVWEVAKNRFESAHFATMPKGIVMPCILAGTSAKGHCPSCGKRWVRDPEWHAGCSCDVSPIPDVVLDPFSGAATVGLVADNLGCSYIGIELNPEYDQIGRERLIKKRGFLGLMADKSMEIE